MPKLVCWSGTTNRIPKITSTPATCHQTLTSFSSATSRIPKVFIRPWIASTPVYAATRISFVISTSNAMLRNAQKNAAKPKSIPAVTATWPRKLNQPVNQDQAAPFFGATFADQ